MRWKKHISLQRKCKRILTKESQLIITENVKKRKITLRALRSNCYRQDSSMCVKMIGQKFKEK